MKKHYFLNYRLLMMSVCLLCFFSCNKDKFEFDRLSNIDASGEWGLPLLKIDYTAEDLLDKLDNANYIIQDGEGNLYFEYMMEEAESINAIDFLQFPDVGGQETFTFDNVGIPSQRLTLPFSKEIQLENEQVEVQQGYIKSGMFTINFNHNINSEYSLRIICPNITSPTGEPLQIEVASQTASTFQKTIDLAGYRVAPAASNMYIVNSEISFLYKEDPSIDKFTVSMGFQFKSLALRSLYCKLAPYSIRFDMSSDFELLSKNLGGEITLYNPELALYAKNSFLVPGQINIEKAQLKGESGSTSLISHDNLIVNFPISPIEYTKTVIDKLPELPLNTSYNSIELKSMATLNPDGFNAGTLLIDENSSASFKIGATIPFNLMVEDTYFYDTLDLDLSSVVLPEIGINGDTADISDFIEHVNFRFMLQNGLPLSLSAQAYFYDDENGVILDSLFRTDFSISGSYNGTAVENTSYADITEERLDNIFASNKLIIRFTVDTDDRDVFLNAKQYLRAALAVRVKYYTKNINLF